MERAQRSGELAFLLEPDLKDARGGLRDVHAIQAVAAAWVAPGPGPRVRAAYESIMDARHALHEVTGRPTDRLVLQEQDEVARVLGLLDADALMRHLAGAGRTIAYSVDQAFRQAERSRGGRRRGKAQRRPVADGLVEQDGEVVLARAADPATDPVLLLRAAAAAAQAGLSLPPRTLTRLAGCPPLPVPWPPEARDALVALLGAGPPAIPVWEALDQEGLIATLLPDWDRVRNRPQRNPLHTYTVDRHLVEAAARAAALTRDVARPDLLLLSALLHDIGKGWPGDHRVTGEVVARDVARRVGLGPSDAELVAGAVRHHLLLPQTATRRDLDDPVTVAQVAEAVGGRPLLELLHALAIADGLATGPAAWNDWKENLVGDLVRRVESVLAGELPPEPLPLRPDQQALADQGVPGRAGERLGSDHRRPGPPRAAVGGRRGARLAPAGGAFRQRHLARADGGGGLHRGPGVRRPARRGPGHQRPAPGAGGAAGRGGAAGAPDAGAPRLPGPGRPAQGHPGGRRVAHRDGDRSARPTTGPACSGGSAGPSATAAWTCGRPGWRPSAPRPSTCSTWWMPRAARWAAPGSGGRSRRRYWPRSADASAGPSQLGRPRPSAARPCTGCTDRVAPSG